MKDYSLNVEESKQFIKNYKVENGQIIAKLANGEDYIIPYSEENENKILKRMENQVEKINLKELNTSKKVYAILQPLVLPIAIINFINNGGVFYGILLSTIAIGAVVYPLQFIYHKLKEREIKKLNYFLNNQKELNENVKKNENILSGVSKKATRQIKQTPAERPVFDINVIDNYSLSDLITIRENIKRYFSFDFTDAQQLETEEEKSSTFKELKVNYFLGLLNDGYDYAQGIEAIDNEIEQFLAKPGERTRTIIIQLKTDRYFLNIANQIYQNNLNKGSIGK